MMFDTCKPVIKFQTALGGVQCILFAAALGSILGTLQKYHDSDRLNFNCDPKPSDFIRQRCYNSYISTVTKPHGLIPRNVVAITLGVLCACWISFAIYGAVTFRKRPGDRKDTKKFLCAYLIHVFFRILFLGVMVGLVCSYQKISLPSVFECDVNQILQTNSQTTPSPLNQANLTLQCNDLHHKEKSNLNIAFISVGASFMVFSVLEVLHLCRNRKNYLENLVGDPDDIELLQGLREKPTITNTETEVDKDFVVTWSEAEAKSSNCSVKYRLEWRKQPMTGSTVMRENIVETHLKITGLEYDAEYEVKLFAVNEQGESEADVRTFKTKSAISRYTTYLQASIISQTEFQPKLLASRTISNAKTDEIFTNLLIQHGRKALFKNDETYSRGEELEYYGKVSGTPVKHCSEIFHGMIDDQESANSILVVGKAGIGKTLFCQKVIRDWAKNELFQARENTKIPNLKCVYLLAFRQLNFLEDECVTLREIFNFSSVLDDNCNIDDTSFEYILKHPKEVMIILDGYDEYSKQYYIAGNLEEQHPNNGSCKMPVAALCSKLIKGKILKGAIVMITSRPDESDRMGGIRFKRYVEIAGFSSKQVQEYIEKYFKDDENIKNAVLKHVMNNMDLVSFAHIPMLCFLLCFEMEYILTKSGNRDDLPVSTTDIYTKLVDIFELKHCAESEYRQKEIPEQFKPPPVIKNTLDKLSKLAAKLLCERKPTFDESEMEGEFEADEVNELKGSGLLYCGQPFRTALIRTTKHFSFTHLTVQEFLAARWFVKENRLPDGECSGMVFQFMAGVLSSEGNEELMEKLMDSPIMSANLKMTCLNEYQNREFAKKFIMNNPKALNISHKEMALKGLSDVDYIGVSFVLDIISELNKEEAGGAFVLDIIPELNKEGAEEEQCKRSYNLVTVERLDLQVSQLTRSAIQRLCNSLNNKYCHVSLLTLSQMNFTDEYAHAYKKVVSGGLTIPSKKDTKNADTLVARLCKELGIRR